MKTFIFFALAWGSFLPARGQAKKFHCRCSNVFSFASDTGYSDEVLDTLFQLSKTNILLCGNKYESHEDSQILLYSFILIAGKDTIDSFWAPSYFGYEYQIQVNKDTLLIRDIKNLPIGDSLLYQDVLWETYKVYFISKKCVIENYVNRKIPKYNSYQIKKVLDSFEIVKRNIDSLGNEDKLRFSANKAFNDLMRTAHKLFMAAISGSAEAKKYLKNYNEYFGMIDFQQQHEYLNLERMLELWDSDTKTLINPRR